MKLVEQTVRLEHASSPNKPIYLLGESFGGCLALAVAARNPTIDLVVILVNPGQFPDLQFHFAIISTYPSTFVCVCVYIDI